MQEKTPHELITNALDVNLSVMGMNIADGETEKLADMVIIALDLAGFTISRKR